MTDPLASISRWLPRSSDERLPSRGFRIGAKALVVEDGDVLLVKERRTDGSDFWTLPGGGVQPGETVERALRRELGEELRCDVVVGGPVAPCYYDHESRPNLTTAYVVFDCWLIGEPKPNRADGIVDYEWFGPGTLPVSTLAPFERVVSGNV